MIVLFSILKGEHFLLSAARYSLRWRNNLTTYEDWQRGLIEFLPSENVRDRQRAFNLIPFIAVSSFVFAQAAQLAMKHVVMSLKILSTYFITSNRLDGYKSKSIYLNRGSTDTRSSKVFFFFFFSFCFGVCCDLQQILSRILLESIRVTFHFRTTENNILMEFSRTLFFLFFFALILLLIHF